LNDDVNNNTSVIQDIEKNSSEFTKGIYIIFDTCCRFYQLYKDCNKDNNINIKDIHQKGYKIYEIIQAIQEGKKTNEEIINYLAECKKAEIPEKNEKNEKKLDKNDEKNEKKSTDNKMDIDNNNNSANNNNQANNNNIGQISNDNVNINNNNDDNNNNNLANNMENNIIRVIEEGFDNENEADKSKDKKTKKINIILKQIQDIPLYPDSNFIKDIKNIFNDNNETLEKDNNSKDNNFTFNKHRNELYPYNNDNYIKSLNIICNIIGNCSISYLYVNDMRKMNLEYRIKEFGNNNDLLQYLSVFVDKINNNNNNNISEEEKYKNELKYKRFMNYSILRYKTLNKNFYNNINISSYNEFISKTKIVSNALISVQEVINKSKNNINNNHKMTMKLIYENILTVYIIFCFLDHCKKNFEEQKKFFLENFLLLLKESYNTQNICFINEPILILCLQIIIQFFNDSDNSLELLNQFLNDNNLLKLILDLKFNSEDANMDFYENKFKFFVTIDQCFKQFLHKIFSEKDLYEHLLESVFKYTIANIECDNYEINLDDFTNLLIDFIKIDNNKHFENVNLKLFKTIYCVFIFFKIRINIYIIIINKDIIIIFYCN
jgi:hypothetical protein